MGDQFPAGLRVLVVDDDRTCLAILKKMLLSCAYNVTTCGMARLALAMLRENKERFDVVLSDVYMPDMDGFKLLELVGLEMDLPVIMMSADGETSLVMKGITHGACDYLLKPIRIKELRNIWQHVIRKKRNILKDVESFEQDKQKRKPDEGDLVGPATSSKKRRELKEDEEDPELDLDDSSALKKPRVVWSVELHQQFVTAVNQLGIDKAVPKRILELMNVQGLTRENVASHLQKYRLYLKRLSVAQHQHQNPVIGSDPSFSPVDGLQPHPIITPSSSQALAALRSAYLRTLCSPSEPALSGVESPVFVVRPRPPAANNQRNLLLGVEDDNQLQQSQIVGNQLPQSHMANQFPQTSQIGNQLPLSQIGPIGQNRTTTQDGFFPSSTGVSSEQLIQQQQQQQQQRRSQIQQYSQKQGSNTYLDYPSFKDSSELSSRNTNLESEGIITLPPNRSFSSDVLGGIMISSSGAAKTPNLSGLSSSTGIIKCEETDPLSSWEAGSSYGGQINWQEQHQGSDFLQSSIVPYSSSSGGTAATSQAFDMMGGGGSSDLMQRQQEYLGAAICPLGNSFKVKQEQSYENHQFSQDELSACLTYNRFVNS